MASELVGVDEETAQSVQPAGRFRIYLGAAAGVGKTCAMLDEGWRRHERGKDVVVAYVETHGRDFTAGCVRGLEVVPRKKVEYRGTVMEEMDLEAVIARAPEVALVDELAHTNVPGAGNEKRWQDVIALLDAGIAVVSTVNVQHLESIADAVEAITGTPVRERVPDWVVRSADQLELVDSSPEQLRRRMLHGHIYPAEKVPQALSGFFRVENLTALRDLALRFVADETEDELQAYLQQLRPTAVWDTAERILVAVTAAKGTDAVIRRAARFAARMKADMHVVHVRDHEETPEAREEIGRLEKLARDVSASWEEIDGSDRASALVRYAHEHQITQIVLGSSRRRRFTELTRPSVVSRLLKAANDSGIDVHVISREGRATGRKKRPQNDDEST